jgi:predicted DNA-binding transcriptional regulator AlpA
MTVQDPTARNIHGNVMVRPQNQPTVLFTPSGEYLRRCRKFLLTMPEFAQFLGVSVSQAYRLVYSDRIPLPLRLGFGRCLRWSIFELQEWVEGGCPPRGEWLETRGWSGYLRRPGRP